MTGAEWQETKIVIDNPADQFKKQLDDALSKGSGPKAARFA
jgi:hypothetical protein